MMATRLQCEGAVAGRTVKNMIKWFYSRRSFNMAKLPKYTLTHNERKDRWDLTNDKSDKVVKTFDTKAKATKGGVLERALGTSGGSVKIQKQNGRYQEERTYPGSADPKSSKG
jgi:hypothetical protein